jgi:hypothetical protein
LLLSSHTIGRGGVRWENQSDLELSVVSKGFSRFSEANGADVELNGTKAGALDCVTTPKPVRAAGFPTLRKTSDIETHGAT